MTQTQTQPKTSIHAREYASFLVRYLKPRLVLVIVLAVTLLVSIGLQLVNPQILRSFIDAAMAGSAINLLTRMALTFIGIAIGQQLIGVLVVYITENLGWATTNDLRLELARYCLGLDMSFHTSHTPGEMIERIDGDVMALSNFFSQFILQVFGNLPAGNRHPAGAAARRLAHQPVAGRLRGASPLSFCCAWPISPSAVGRRNARPAPTCTASWKNGCPARRISAPITPRITCSTASTASPAA